ncbi:MAG: QueT transporter family protein [Clostridium sp.]
MNIKKISVTNLVKVSVIAALYVVLTMAVAPISYGSIQFRISEVLNLLVFFNPIYGISLIIGCALSNMFSPFGIYDVVFGTLSTAISVYFIAKSKNLFVASLWPSLFIPIIVGIEITILNSSAGEVTTLVTFIATAASILASEFIVMTIIAYPLFNVLSRNERLISYVRS